MKFELGLAGKKAVVVGGARGIGRATAEILAGEGADVAICVRGEEDVQQAVEQLTSKGISAHGAAVDVTDKEVYGSWIADAGEAIGGIDIQIVLASGVG